MALFRDLLSDRTGPETGFWDRIGLAAFSDDTISWLSRPKSSAAQSQQRLNDWSNIANSPSLRDIQVPGTAFAVGIN